MKPIRAIGRLVWVLARKWNHMNKTVTGTEPATAAAAAVRTSGQGKARVQRAVLATAIRFPSRLLQGRVALIGMLALLLAAAMAGGPAPILSKARLMAAGSVIDSLTVNDPANAGSWTVQQNLQVGDTAYGDRTYTWTSVPSALLGATWIQTAANSKTVTTNPLASFTLNQPAIVSVALDTRVGPLSWIDSSWTDTGTQMVTDDANAAQFEVFQRSFGPGTVTLGPNAGPGSTYLMYTVVITPIGTPGCTHAGPNPGNPPGCNFDLSIWSLQLPIGQPGAPTTISNADLEAGFTDQFFFTGSDGAMVFVDPGVDCVTTPNSNHCRTELREVNTDGTNAVWSASGTNTLSATLTVTDAAGAPVVGQIHLDPAISARPLIELFYTSSGDIVAGVEQCNEGGCETRTTLGHVPPGTQFSYVIDYSNNVLTVSIDGGPPQPLASPILGEGGYFKAGAYGQSPANAAVSFYALNVLHA